ncbi:hypothetical protein HN937_16985 [Candidatus Poribacteria bacterium]|jgi:hypothetical protein|nr:hypothetical protein [Candidatus Poribacteria bacterium]
MNSTTTKIGEFATMLSERNKQDELDAAARREARKDEIEANARHAAAIKSAATLSVHMGFAVENASDGGCFDGRLLVTTPLFTLRALAARGLVELLHRPAQTRGQLTPRGHDVAAYLRAKTAGDAERQEYNARRRASIGLDV